MEEEGRAGLNMEMAKVVLNFSLGDILEEQKKKKNPVYLILLPGRTRPRFNSLLRRVSPRELK